MCRTGWRGARAALGHPKPHGYIWETPACELHRCERGPGARFCAQHWRPLEAGFWHTERHAPAGFIACLFFLGVGGANFAVYTLRHAEQYRSECHGSAFAFATSFSRFIAAGVAFLVGAEIAPMHTIGTPIAYTAVALLLGIALLPLAAETVGKELPV